MPADMTASRKGERFAMLEKLADHDDELMEQLLADMEPPRDRVFADLARELAEGQITPVLFGSAEHGNGIGRLLKALRHEAPGIAADGEAPWPQERRRRDGAGAEDLPHRAWRQAFAVAGAGGRGRRRRRVPWRQRPGSARRRHLQPAGRDAQQDREGRRRRHGGAGPPGGDQHGRDAFNGQGRHQATGGAQKPAPGVYGLAISVTDRKDEVKLTSAIAKLIEEDPSLSLEHNARHP